MSRSNTGLKVSIIGMCVLSFILGYVTAIRHVNKDLETEYIGYIRCLEDNRCVKDVGFYIRYYELKRQANED